jgi:TPR repeat protein
MYKFLPVPKKSDFLSRSTVIYSLFFTAFLIFTSMSYSTAQEQSKSTYLRAPIKFEQPGKKPLSPDALAALNSTQIESDQKQSPDKNDCSSNKPATNDKIKTSGQEALKAKVPGLPPSTPAPTKECEEAEFVDLAFGAFQRGFYLSAFKLALPRAESGDPAAQTLIAELYDKGQGIALDKHKAASWYRFAAKSGNREAQFAYANILAKGKIVPLDKKRAANFMQKAADAGHHKAQFNFAQMIIDNKPNYHGFAKARPYYEKAAIGGLADAQYVLARMHATGKGLAHSDIKRARKWMTLAAIGGYDTAQMELAIWMAIGKGGPKDEKAALNWFILSSNQGNVIAQNRLAKMYAFGIGTDRNLLKASAWHILARRAGKSDGELDEFFRNLSNKDQKRAIKIANSWRAR